MQYTIFIFKLAFKINFRDKEKEKAHRNIANWSLVITNLAWR